MSTKLFGPSVKRNTQLIGKTLNRSAKRLAPREELLITSPLRARTTSWRAFRRKT